MMRKGTKAIHDALDRFYKAYALFERTADATPVPQGASTTRLRALAAKRNEAEKRFCALHDAYLCKIRGNA